MFKSHLCLERKDNVRGHFRKNFINFFYNCCLVGSGQLSSVGGKLGEGDW